MTLFFSAYKKRKHLHSISHQRRYNGTSSLIPTLLVSISIVLYTRSAGRSAESMLHEKCLGSSYPQIMVYLAESKIEKTFATPNTLWLKGRELHVLEVLPQIAKMQASYALGKPLALPLNLTISVSYRCNSRCKTCNVWQRPNDDFTIEEYDKTFASIGRDPYWFTFSGGEPTLRKDLPEMVEAAYRHCRPGIINIPTNGIQDKIIPERVERVLQAAPTSACDHQPLAGRRGRQARYRARRQGQFRAGDAHLCRSEGAQGALQKLHAGRAYRHLKLQHR